MKGVAVGSRAEIARRGSIRAAGTGMPLVVWEMPTVSVAFWTGDFGSEEEILMLARELAAELGRIFRSELDGLLVDTERGVRKIVRDYTESLRAEFGEDIHETDAARVERGFRAACKRLLGEIYIERHGEEIAAFARKMWTLHDRLLERAWQRLVAKAAGGVLLARVAEHLRIEGETAAANWVELTGREDDPMELPYAATCAPPKPGP